MLAHWQSFLSFACLLAITVNSAGTSTPSPTAPEETHLTTDNEGFLTVIQGFATQIKCVLNTCSDQVRWYKDGVQISSGTKFLNETAAEKSYKFQHSIEVDFEKGCSGECDDSKPCAPGFSCVDNQCCSCRKEDFTLVLRNLTFDDSGRYRCQLGNKSELLEFQVEVLESGLKGGFHENISYDHSECCQQKGISPLCRGMCKPSEMDRYHFDPTSCKTDDYKNFLSCATEGNTRSHVHCCKTQLVPSFCYDFCSGDFKMLRRSHRLCLYYLPEIFSCLDRAYLPYPEAPVQIQVNAIDHDKLSVCWQEPKMYNSNKKFPIIDYTVFYKEIPNFPLLGGDIGLPLLTGDYTDVGDGEDEDEYQQDDDDTDGGVVEVVKDAKKERKRRHVMMIDDGAEISVRRNKRSTMVIVTRDDTTNSTTVREFAFKSINTTQKCTTIKDLRSASRYIVYVTARNEYGTSVPSVRSIASTNVHVVRNNATLPDAMKCCNENNVTSACSSKMCNVAVDPTPMSTISIATTCRAEWPKVSPCIADNRNHTDCCIRKGVQNDCLEICSGSTKELGVHSVLCLNLDLQAIYQCIREGYETHPSSPVNVTVNRISAHGVTIRWDEPQANAHLVRNYTLFLRKNELGQPVRTITNVKSPHTENGLEPDTQYIVSVQSNSEAGASLPSTAKLFTTRPTTRLPICTIGEPILTNDGRVLPCDNSNPCPNGFHCSGMDTDMSYCCPRGDNVHTDDEFQKCCKEQKMSDGCMTACYYNATLPRECQEEVNIWVQCASDGHDHTRCCRRESVPSECLPACRHPFKIDADKCFGQVDRYRKCFAAKQMALPMAVKSIEVTSITHESATVAWEDIEDDIINFRVQLFNNGAMVQAINSSADIYRFSGLYPQQEYKVRVIAINAEGEGPPSWNVTFTTKPLQETESDRPVAPEGVRIVWNSGPRVNVTWNAVTSRRNNEPVATTIEYTVYYLDTEKSSTWTTVTTNQTWLVIKDLRKDALYYVYVTAKEGEKSSRSSSIITILAQQDALGLPEPTIRIEPASENGVYTIGDKLKINCSLEHVKTEGERKLNIDLTFGPHVVQNEHGALSVVLEAETDESWMYDTITCAVSKTDGRQHVANRHLVFKKPAKLSFKRDKYVSYENKNVEMPCIYTGTSRNPNFSFEKIGSNRNLRGYMTIKKQSSGSYTAIWNIRNLRASDAAEYKCIVETNNERVEATTTLTVSPKANVPMTIDGNLVLQCCVDEGVEGDCLKACSIGRASLSATKLDCSKYGDPLLKCAYDTDDHSECCIALGVSDKCLPLCKGGRNHTGYDCASEAVPIMMCYIRDHEIQPIQVKNVRAKAQSNPSNVRIEWDYPPTTDYKYFAVYYRKKNDDTSEWKVQKSLQQSIELDLDNDEDYEIGVMAANAMGHSPIVYMNVAKDRQVMEDNGGSTSKNSSGFWIISILFICGCAIALIAVMGKRSELPHPFGRIIRRHTDANQPTVAFENPAYGTEVEIRGLGETHQPNPSASSSEWQSPSLEASPDEENHEYRNGMRYTKLDT